jgi:hypothetical protein
MGHHRPREVEVGPQLKLQPPISRQGQAPAVLLHQIGGEPMAVVADQGIGAPLGDHLHVRARQHLPQPGQGGADVGVGMVTDEPADGVEIGDGAQLGQGSLDGER